MAERSAGRAGSTGPDRVMAAAPEGSITNEDWYAEDLTGRSFAGHTFVDVDLTETTSTSGARFTDCTFRGVKFNVSNHAGAEFSNCTFSGCNFFSATFTDCKFLGSTFTRCTFDRLSVAGGDWSFVGLPGANLANTSFTDVRMREVDLTGARCDGASLRNCDLSSALWDKANLDRCDLRGSDISAVDPGSVSLRATIIGWDQAAVLASAMGLDVRPE